MDLQNKRILVLGGFGLGGQAVIKRLMIEKPAHVVITSLRRDEAESAVKLFKKRYPETEFEPFWGNLFVREAWKDLTREEILTDIEMRERLVEDTLGHLTDEVLHTNTLYNEIE